MKGAGGVVFSLNVQVALRRYTKQLDSIGKGFASLAMSEPVESHSHHMQPCFGAWGIRIF